jgi:hypothetical protein
LKKIHQTLGTTKLKIYENYFQMFFIKKYLGQHWLQGLYEAGMLV